MKSVLEKSRKVMGWKSHVSWVYIQSEEDTMKNEIPADIFLVPPPPPPPPPPRWGKIFTKLLKSSTTYFLVFIHATAVFQL